MSDKKFNALIRKTELTREEILGFINRQINVVNQSNKILKDVFEILYPDTEIFFSKAQYPSYIRKRLDIPKVRDLNDTHHAVDAYLNIVAGNILMKKYGMRYIKAKEKNEKITFNPERELKRILVIEEDKKPDRFTIVGQKVYETCFRHDFLLTYKNTYHDDAFYDQTIYRKGSTGLIPLHTKNPEMSPEKYGGYKSMYTKYLVTAIKTNHKNNTSSKILIRVPAFYVAIYKNEEELKNKLVELTDLKNDETIDDIDLKNPIYNDQKVLINGCYYLLCSNNAETISLKPFSPIFLETESCKYLKKLDKYRENYKEQLTKENENVLRIDTDKNAKNYVEISKEKNVKLIEELIELSKMEKYQYCTMICKFQEYDINLFKAKTMYEQINEILGMIKIFGRKQENSSLLKSTFRKSMSSFLKNDVYLIYDSVTGLYSRKMKL